MRFRWLILAAAVLLTGALAYLLLPRQAPAIHTGDPLLDAYLLGAQQTLQKENEIFVSIEGLAKLESSFGKDPRYWQLRAKQDYMETLIASVKQLGAARRAGGPIASAARNPTAAKIDALREGQKQDPQDFETLLLLLDASSDQSSSAQKLELLDAAVAAAPEQAWPHYLRGLHFLARDDAEMALAELKLGNRAPDNRLPAYFPYYEIRELRSKGIIGSPELTGLIMTDCSARGLSYQMKVFALLRERLSAEMLADYPELADEINQLAFRLYEADPLLDIASISAAGILSHQAGLIKKNPKQFPAPMVEAAEELLAADKQAEAVNLKVLSIGTDFLGRLAETQDWPRWKRRLVGKRGINQRAQGIIYEQYKAQEKLMRTEMQPYFQAIRGFRYSDASSWRLLDPYIRHGD